MTEKKVVDWELIEKLYRAGVMTVRQIGEQQDISHPAILKRAKKDGWTRDRAKAVQDKAKELVTKAVVTASVTAATKLTDQVVENVMAQKVADIDLADRSDLQDGIDAIRVMGRELAELSRPEFRERLEALGEFMDESYTKDNGAEVKDKFNELYRYIVSLSGRIKMVKDLSSAVNVYIPLRRKVVGLDVEKAESEIDGLLHKIKRERDTRQ